jgi:mRNA interferase RelE/StbE
LSSYNVYYRKDRTAVAKAINNLSENPHPYRYKKLKGSEFYRIRIGDYRVIYEINIDELLVLVVRVGHRRKVYRK